MNLRIDVRDVHVVTVHRSGDREDNSKSLFTQTTLTVKPALPLCWPTASDSILYVAYKLGLERLADDQHGHPSPEDGEIFAHLLNIV